MGEEPCLCCRCGTGSHQRTAPSAGSTSSGGTPRCSRPPARPASWRCALGLSRWAPSAGQLEQLEQPGLDDARMAHACTLTAAAQLGVVGRLHPGCRRQLRRLAAAQLPHPWTACSSASCQRALESSTPRQGADRVSSTGLSGFTKADRELCVSGPKAGARHEAVPAGLGAWLSRHHAAQVELETVCPTASPAASPAATEDPYWAQTPHRGRDGGDSPGR